MADTHSLPQATADLLKHRKPELLSTIKLSTVFWALLEKHQVIPHSFLKERAANTPSSRLISDLVDRLMTGKRSWYLGFLQTLVDTKQAYIVTQVLGQHLPGLPPADKRPPEESDGTNELNAEKWQLLVRRSAALKKHVKISTGFWDALIKNHVLSQFDVEVFLDESSPADQIHSLIEYLKMGTNKAYRGFLYALSQTGQRDVVKGILSEDVSDLSQSAMEALDSGRMLVDGKKHLLRSKTPELLSKVTPTPELYNSLTKHGVMSHTEANTIKTGYATNTRQISEILEHVKKGTMAHYEGFVCSLIETNQRDVVKDLLGEDPSAYQVNYTGPAITNPILHEAIINMKKVYNQGLFQSALHEFSATSQNIDLQTIYTPLDITEIGKHGKRTKITDNQILMNEDGKQSLTICIGEAGSGKSTIAKRLAWLWSQQKHSGYFWSKIKAVIFIEPTDEGENLEETIKNAVPGKRAYKDMVWDMFRDEPENVLIIVEAFDQYRNAAVVKDIKQMLKDRAANVFLTIRKNHPHLTAAFQSNFTQQIEINGFTQNDGAQFAKKALAEMKCVYETQGFLNAIQGKPRLDTNPLNLMLACQLYSEGELDEKSLETLTEVDLYTMREARMVDREIIRREEAADDHVPQITTEQLEKVHTLALYLLLGQKTFCTKTDLDFLGIESTLPLMVLLEKRRSSTVRAGQQNYWVWPHTRLHEFDAAMALSKMTSLRDSQWLHWIASRPDLNPVAQLTSALLGMNMRYDEVAVLTMATMVLQRKTECQVAMVEATNQQHACHWATDVQKGLSDTMNIHNGFAQGQCNPMHIEAIPPDLAEICKCCGSLFQNNVKLYQHVQHCWEVGLVMKERENLVSESIAVLLPAVDRSEADTVHMMVSEPSDWKRTITAPEYDDVTVLEIHAGMSVKAKEGLFAKDSGWQESLQEQLDCLHPEVVHVHHQDDQCLLRQEVVHSVNDRSYLIQPKRRDLTIWKSDNAETTQAYIPGTSRFAFKSKTKDNDLIINVNKMRDAQHVEHSEDDFNGVFFNIGFPITSSPFLDAEVEETPSQWHDVIGDLLDTWDAPYLLMQSYKAEMLDESVDNTFMAHLRTEKGYDTIHQSEGVAAFIRMIDPQTEVGGHPTCVYNSHQGFTTLRVQHLSHLSDITPADLQLNINDTLDLLLSDCEQAYMGINGEDVMRTCIQRLFAEFGVRSVNIYHDRCRSDGGLLLEEMYGGCSVWADGAAFKAESDGRKLQITRNEDAHLVKVPDTHRFAIICGSKNKKVKIRVDHPSDCMVLQAHHPNRDEVDTLSVVIGTVDVSVDDCLGPVKHLLHVYQPSTCGVQLPLRQQAVRAPGCTLQCGDGVCYAGMWNRDHSCLTFNRFEDVQLKGVHDWTTGGLETHGDDIEDDSAGTESHQTWRRRVQHLLDTYTPSRCFIHTEAGQGRMGHCVTFQCSADEGCYIGTVDQEHSYFVISRQDLLQSVIVPETSRCIQIQNTAKGNVSIVTEHLSDCMALQKDLLQDIALGTLTVHLTPVSDGEAEEKAGHGSTGGWQKVIYHLLETYHLAQVGIYASKSEAEIERTLSLVLEDGTLYHGEWAPDCDVFIVRRVDDLQVRNVPASSRCVGIQDTKAEQRAIFATQLTDCVTLRGEQTKTALKSLDVYLDLVQHGDDDKSDDAAPRDWKATVHYLLRTFPSQRLCIYVQKAGLDIKDNTAFILEEGSFYYGRWIKDNTLFCISRQDEFKLQKVLNTSRHVVIRDVEGHERVVFANRLSDCMTLHKEHIKNTGLDSLGIYLDLVIFGDSEVQDMVTEGWLEVFQHLLGTFRLQRLYINALRADTQIKDKMSVVLDYSTLYYGEWTLENTVFELERQDGFQILKVANTSRCVATQDPEGKYGFIIANRLSDCSAVNKDHMHMKSSGLDSMTVYLNLVSFNPETEQGDNGAKTRHDNLGTENEQGITNSNANGGNVKTKNEAETPEAKTGQENAPSKTAQEYKEAKAEQGYQETKTGQGNLLAKTAEENQETEIGQENAETKASQEPNSKWLRALYHLLETFHPDDLQIHGLKPDTGIKDHISLVLQDSTVYGGAWNKSNTGFSGYKQNEVQITKVPNTSRCVGIRDIEGQFGVILANRVSDCLAVQADHIKKSSVDSLTIYLDLILGPEQYLQQRKTTGWEEAFRHLLGTFRPQDLGLYVARAEADIPERVCVQLEGGSVYAGAWANKNGFLLERQTAPVGDQLHGVSRAEPPSVPEGIKEAGADTEV